MQRKGRKLALTAAGKRVYAFARLALDHQYRLVDDLNSLRQGRNQLRLEVTPAIGEKLLPDILLNFADTFPQFKVQSRMGYSRHIQTHLATGLADIALLELAPDHPDILVQKWLDDELILLCAPNHPLSGKGPIPLSELTRQHYVLREAKSSMRYILDRELKDTGIPALPIALEVGSTDTIVEMLGRGKHLSFLPRFAVQDALSSKLLQHIRVKGLRIKVTLWIARNRSNINNPVAEAFIELIRNSAQP
jgi:DNA-binding transcriptional LysR family regulator